MSALVSKLLQLADAGVGLGINVISLINSYTQHQARQEPPQEAHQPAPGPAPAAPAPNASAEHSYCIINRTPLHPGSAVRVSFSISNEQPDAVRRLRVSVLAFTGATSGAALPANFSVDTPEREVGPMDFERFVLCGSIPDDAPPDSYAGWVQVDGDEQMRIPVMLLVSPAG
jgi:hypothetical protein